MRMEGFSSGLQLTFFLKLGIIVTVGEIIRYGGAHIMRRKGSKCAIFIGLIVAFTAIIAAAVAVLLYVDKKKEEEDLEHYLDCSIQ